MHNNSLAPSVKTCQVVFGHIFTYIKLYFEVYTRIIILWPPLSGGRPRLRRVLRATCLPLVLCYAQQRLPARDALRAKDDGALINFLVIGMIPVTTHHLFCLFRETTDQGVARAWPFTAYPSYGLPGTRYNIPGTASRPGSTDLLAPDKHIPTPLAASCSCLVVFRCSLYSAHEISTNQVEGKGYNIPARVT